jgi:hypothetical protein
MSYPEFTSCTSVDGAVVHKKDGAAPWSEMITAGISASLIHGTAVTIIAGILAVASLSLFEGAVAISLLIGALYAVVTYCDWWLKYRLVCLDGDNNHCAIGFVAKLEPPEGKTGFDAFDTDFSMNVGIVGTWFGDSDLDAVRRVEPYGYLLKSEKVNKPITGVGFHLTGVNSFGNDKATEDDAGSPYFSKPSMKVLHAEFEGEGVARLREWTIALIALLIVADVLALACAGGFFWACILLYFLAVLFVGGVLGGISSALGAKANPGEIDKALGSLAVGNIVLVSGRWVYDAGHSDEGTGWNEIHPIRHCQIIQPNPPDPFDGDWGKVFPLRLDEWCKQVSDAGSSAVKDEQQKPEHGWEIHPLIDGCRAPSSGGAPLR